MLRVNNHLPANRTLLRSVLMMVLRRQLTAFFCYDLSAASWTSIDA